MAGRQRLGSHPRNRAADGRHRTGRGSTGLRARDSGRAGRSRLARAPAVRVAHDGGRPALRRSAAAASRPGGRGGRAPCAGADPGPEPEPEPAPEPVAAPMASREPKRPPEPEPASAPEPEPVHEPELVVTASMAEVFLRQGYPELARAVYVQLAERDPSDTRIAAALAELQPEPASPPPPPAPELRFDATSTGGRSVQQLFSAILSAGRPASSATVHPPAFEPSRRPTGEPTRPAQESLSLSAVFGEESAPAGSASGSAPRPNGGPSFDEFYAAPGGSGGGSELPKGPASAPSSAPASTPEDLEQFNAWLRGLKR